MLRSIPHAQATAAENQTSSPPRVQPCSSPCRFTKCRACDPQPRRGATARVTLRAARPNRPADGPSMGSHARPAGSPESGSGHADNDTLYSSTARSAHGPLLLDVPPMLGRYFVLGLLDFLYRPVCLCWHPDHRKRRWGYFCLHGPDWTAGAGRCRGYCLPDGTFTWFDRTHSGGWRGRCRASGCTQDRLTLGHCRFPVRGCRS